MYAMIHSGRRKGGGSSDFNPTLFQNPILKPNKECKLMTQFFPREKAVSGTLFCAHLHVFETRELGLNPIFHDQIFQCFIAWKNLLSDLEGQEEQIQICSLQAGFSRAGLDTPEIILHALQAQLHSRGKPCVHFTCAKEVSSPKYSQYWVTLGEQSLFSQQHLNPNVGLIHEERGYL